MNLAKVFRRQQHPQGPPKPIERPSLNHQHPHRYNRPFSYHIPKTEQASPPRSPTRPTSVIPYRIGLSGDSTLLGGPAVHDPTDIVRLPTKSGRDYKNRRYHSQLNANKRWLYRSMETLDGWKGKVFSPKIRTPKCVASTLDDSHRPLFSSSSQSRSRSVENLADGQLEVHVAGSTNRSRPKQQRALSPHRSFEAITHRVINTIGIHRKSTSSIPAMARSPALTIQKQSSATHLTNGPQAMAKTISNGSAILDFREISSSEFVQARARLTEDIENMSLSPSENNQHSNNGRDDNDNNEEIASDLSFLITNQDANQSNNGMDDPADPWDFSITWIDSLKEQQSPQRKIQFYENLIKLLEQDTLSIDELLVLRKVLAKIWPTDDPPALTTTMSNSPSRLNFIDLKATGTKSLHAPNRVKRRAKLSTLTRHTAQRCTAVLEQSPSAYEAMHEQNSGHELKPSSLLVAARASPCVVEDHPRSLSDRAYPSHLNPFDDEPSHATTCSPGARMDIAASAPPNELDNSKNASIRRYFERLTLLETIYEKLNIESNRTTTDTADLSPPTKLATGITTDAAKTVSSRFLEMNVDSAGSVSSGKSSSKRRAPTAPHASQPTDPPPSNPQMFTLSSTDLRTSPKRSQDISIPIRFVSNEEKISTSISPKAEPVPAEPPLAAACDDDGHVFVFDSQPTAAATSPKQTERIQEWLSACTTQEEPVSQTKRPPAPSTVSPTTQLKIRCTAKPVHHPSPPRSTSPVKQLSPSYHQEYEPGRFRTSLKIHLESTEPVDHRSRLSSATTRPYSHSPISCTEDTNTNEYRYFPRHALSPSFGRDHQAVYL